MTSTHAPNVNAHGANPLARGLTRAVVTGGAGFIGSHLARLLCEQGIETLVIDNLSAGSRDAVVAAAHFEEIDIRDAESLTRVFASFEPDAVFHLAAHIDVTASIANPVFDADVNVCGTVTVVKAAVEAGARAVVFASSAAVYGNPQSIPVPEEAPLLPLAPYGASKKAAEDYVRLLCDAAGVRWSVLRLSNVYGPGQQRRPGGGVVPILFHTCLAGETAVLYGYGDMKRDFVYVGDVVDAFVRAARKGSGTYNIATGSTVSLNELFEQIHGLVGRGDARRAPARDGEILAIALDPGRAQRELGWRARTSLEEGLREALLWYQARIQE